MYTQFLLLRIAWTRLKLDLFLAVVDFTIWSTQKLINISVSLKNETKRLTNQYVEEVKFKKFVQTRNTEYREYRG